MKLTKLSLANYRGFEQLDITFEPDITVIAGVNGVGKSSVLNALAVLLSRALPEFTSSRAKLLYFTDDQIHRDRASLEVSIKMDVDTQLLSAGIQRVRDSEDESDRFLLLRQDRSLDGSMPESFSELLRHRTLTGDVEAGMKETRAALKALKVQDNPPLAIYFSPKRQLPGQPKTLPVPKPFDPSQAYNAALADREVDLREFMYWFRTQETLGVEGDSLRAAVLDSLRKVVGELIPEFSSLRIEESPRLGLVVEKDGKPLYLHQLSDGERGLLALVFDLTRRLAIANPESEDPIREGVALVLLDEVELHLHPKWQREVLRRFTDIFESCQFVVTTHSPLVLGEVEARCIRFLEWEDSKVVATVPQESLGLDANRILLELMEAPVRNEQMEEQLNALFDLIDDERFDEARTAMSNLRSKLGEHEPELTRASSLLKFLEGEE